MLTEEGSPQGKIKKPPDFTWRLHCVSCPCFESLISTRALVSFEPIHLFLYDHEIVVGPSLFIGLFLMTEAGFEFTRSKR